LHGKDQKKTRRAEVERTKRRTKKKRRGKKNRHAWR